MKADEVHLVRLGERQGLAYESGQALTEGTVKAFNVVSEAAVFAYSLMVFGGKNSMVSPPEVGVANALFVVGRDSVPEQLAGSFTATTHNTSYDLPRPFTKC